MNPGPYETEQQVRELPSVRGVYAAFGADPGVGKMAPHSLRILDEACSAAGVETGAYDRRILSWLAGFEPATCAVVAGLITRASRGLTLADLDTIRRALDDAAAYQSERTDPGACSECARFDPAPCGDHAPDPAVIAAYEDLAAKLAGA